MTTAPSITSSVPPASWKLSAAWSTARFPGQADVARKAPGKMMRLDVGGQFVTVVVEREQVENDLASEEYPADRSV